MKYTPEQHQAIHTRDVSIGLSSGAGCGKTFVLTQRLLAHLSEGGSLRELAAITFTERAAREMRDRVRERIQERLLEADGHEERKLWLDHSRELESARISTIHAFCGSFLRANAVEAGLDPNFATLDQAQAESLLSTVIDDELRRQLADRSEDAIGLIISFALRDVIGMIRSLLDKRANLDLESWQAATVDDVLDAWQAYFRDEYLPRRLNAFVESEATQTAMDVLATHRSTNNKMEVFRTGVLEQLPKLAQAPDIAKAMAGLVEVSRVQGGGGAKAWDTPEIYEAVKSAMSKIRDAAKALSKQLDFDREASRHAAENGLRLLRVTGPILQEYRRRKTELAALDFEDLLILTRDLLRNPANASLRKRTAAGLKLLLVDELQDTDPLQIELVKTMCDNDYLAGRVFVVGDYKQSIYRFRGADPRVFRRLLDDLPAAGRMSLTTSFRSQPGVLDFVNALFHEPFQPDYEPLEPHRQQTLVGPSTEFIWSLQQDEELSAEQSRREEARLIARRIREMLEGEERIVADRDAEKRGEPQMRAVREEDIAILFRALSDVQYYEEALRSEGIKYYLVGGHAFYAQQEIFDVLNVLRAIAHPDDQVAAIGALRSPMFALTDETFYWLFRNPHGFRAILSGTVPPPAELDEQQSRQVKFAAKTMKELRALKDRVTISALMDEVLRRTGYDAALLGEFLGERKLANIRKLVNQARSFQTADGFALDEFISRLAEFVASQPREALAAIHPEAAGVVRLMTIHQSKGLEFPVVFVPDIDRRELYFAPKALFHPELGPLVRQHRDERNKTTTGLAMIREEEDLEERAETTRLFYVATTRAADYLVLSSSLESFEQLKGPWTKLLAERFDLKSGQYIGNRPDGWSAPQAYVFAPEDDSELKRSRSRRVSIEKVVADVRANLPNAASMPGKTVAAIASDESARREFSFSRLSGALRELPPEDYAVTETAPRETHALAEGGNRDAALALGNLIHAVLERADFSQPQAVLQRLKKLAGQPSAIGGALLAEEQWAEQVQVAEGMLRKLMQTSLATKIAAAPVVEREIDFLLPMPEAANAHTGQYLRGVIDLLYQDSAGNWHVLDYKTNNVFAEHVQRIAADYELQMFVYAEAVQQILGVAPASVSLFFLRPGIEHPFHFNADDHQRLSQALAVAIERLPGKRAEQERHGAAKLGSASPSSANTSPTGFGQQLLSEAASKESGGPPPPFTLRAESRRRVTRKR